MELGYSKKVSLVYHDIFKYPLAKSDLSFWKPRFRLDISKYKFGEKAGYYFVKPHSNYIEKRLINESESFKKLTLLSGFTKLLEKFPFILFVGVTGSLAMRNASRNSDIDLMIITRKSRLWLTRLLLTVYLKMKHVKTRRPGSNNEKDKLCFNLWLDEKSLRWIGNKNIYTAHEIIQIKPVINKENTYQRFISENSWYKNYWHSKISPHNTYRFDRYSRGLDVFGFVLDLINFIAFIGQYLFMFPKRTTEKINLNTAIFHPKDWSKIVSKKIDSTQ